MRTSAGCSGFIIFILKLWIVNKIYVNINIKIIKINIYVYDFIWIG